jgi:GAF domain-containing protein
VFRQIANLIEQEGDALASAWQADLERRDNGLVSTDNRRQLWRDARTWVALLLRAMRTGDVGPLHRTSRLTARRLALGGIALADVVEAIVSFKHVLWQALRELPELDSEVMHEATRTVAEWFDGMIISTVANYDAMGRDGGSRTLTVERALRLSRLAEDQVTVSDLAHEMVAERNVRRLPSLIARSAAHLAGAQRAAVAVPDDGAPRYRGAYRLALGDLNAYIRRSGRPLSGALEPTGTRIIADLAEGASIGLRRAAARLQVHVAMSVPLRVGDRVLGLLELFDPLAGQDWSEREVTLVRELASRGALAMENAQLLAEAEQRAQTLAVLNEIARGLSSHINSPRLFAVAAAGAARLLRAPSALLWLRAPGSARFMLRAAYGRGRPPGSLDFSAGDGPLGLVLGGETAIMSPQASRGMPWGKGWAVAAPLRVGSSALGLLVVRRKQGAFGDEDVRMLEALGGQIVAAVQNAHLYQESSRLGQRINASIVALGDALAAALDMHELLQVIADRSAELVEADAAIVFMKENGTSLAARAVATRGEDAGAAADPQAYEPVAALAVERGEAVTVAARSQAATEGVRRVMLREHVRAVHVIPLSVRGRMAGTLCILTRGRGLRRQERQLLASFSRQAAVGVENVILFSETQQRLAELADLSRASAGVTSTLDQTAIVEIMVESVARALRAPVAAIALLDDDRELRLPEGGYRGLPASFVRGFTVGPDCIAASVMTDQRIKVISDVAAEGRAHDSLVAGLDLASVICAPIKGRQQLLGVIFAADRVPRIFRQHEEALLSAYANEAALALQNARHYQAVVGHARELEGILEATKTVTSTIELQPVLDHVARAAVSLLGVPASGIMLLDASGQHLTTVATCGLPAEHELHAGLHAGESIPGMVALKGVAMTSTNLPRDGRFRHRNAARAEGLRSMISVPLSVKGKRLGVLTAYSGAARPFTVAEERLLATLAAQASVAIENARLYAAAREQTRSMRLLMEEVNHRIKNNLQSIIGIVQLHIAQVDEPRVQDALREIIARVQAITVVHELLLDEDVRSIDVREAGRRVLDNALRQNPNPHLKLSGQVSGARVRLPSRQATSLASVLNELVYNAVVHAFTGREHGNIAISMQEATGGEILVQVSDDGVGLPRDFNLQHHAHLGLRIVEGLVSQDLGGEFTITGNGGTIARVAFRK